MKAILQLNNNPHKKNGLEFIDDLAFVKICGKMLISYYFDFLYQVGVNEIFIASNNEKNIQHRLRFIDTLNIGIKFIHSSNSKHSYLALFDQVKNEDLLIIDGYGFIKKDLSLINKTFFDTFYNTLFMNKGFQLIYISKHFTDIDFEKLELNFNLDLKEINSISDYFFISDHIIEDLDSHYVLPGYSNEEGIIIGKNVEIDKECKLIAPVIIMDNVKICGNSQIGPKAVINQNVFIEPSCEIINSIVYDNTYLNTNLKLDYKFILSNIIVDRNNIKVYNIDKKFAFTNTYGSQEY